MTTVGPTLGCFVTSCIGETWPGEDWLIFDTPVGAFEVLLCDEHYADYEAGRLSLQPASLRAAVELVLEHPVVHA